MSASTRTWLALSAALLAAGCSAQAETRTAGVVDGEGVYTTYCTQCHGDDGSGNMPVGAPSIGGLPEWYVKAQLAKFRDGARGTHIDDVGGMKMRPMALTLANQEQVDSVSAYIAAMPKVKTADTLHGDPAKGATAFAVCAACHGQDGSGMQALGAPPLSVADDWYMLVQLRNFKGGVRGTNPKDSTGATMRPMAMTLANEQAMYDVIAYVRSLDK